METDAEKLVKTIREKSGLSEEEITAKIDAKVEELGGLVGEVGAAHLIARELDISLPAKDSTGESALKIESVFAGMNNVDVVGKTIRKFPHREFTRKDGSPGKVGSAIIGDNTGKLRVVFWDGDVQKLEELRSGDILKLRSSYCKEGLNGTPELHVGMRTRVIINPSGVESGDFPEIESRSVKASQLEGGMGGVDIVCKVLRIFEPREFKRDDGSSGRVVNILASDETGVTRLTLWDEQVENAEKIEEGDVVEVKNAYVKKRNGKTDVNIGKYGSIEVNPSIKLENAVDSLQPQASRKPLKEAEEGEVVEVRGAVLDMPQARVFEKDSKKGVVVNAIIDDGTASMRTAFYNELAESLTGIPLEQLLEEEYEGKLEERKGEVLAREVVLTARVKRNSFTEKLELVARDINLNPDAREEAGLLLKRMEG